MKPTHLDLFSGIGGFALAAQWAGFETIGFSEIDPYASQILKKHWPTVPNHGDIHTVPTVRCDLITGGFPCQPFSLAGKRRGKTDDRHLWPAMRDVIRRCRPAWVLGENVPGIIGVELDQVLTDLEGLGYRVQPFVIPACAVDAPHRRDRIWIVANASGQRRQQECRCSFGDEKANEGRTAQHDHIAPGCSKALANPEGDARKLQQGKWQDLRNQPTINGQERIIASDTECLQRSTGRKPISGQAKEWGTSSKSRGHLWIPEAESGVCRVADGVPNRAHRLRSLGNAIVPQVAQVILQAIYKELTKEHAVA